MSAWSETLISRGGNGDGDALEDGETEDDGETLALIDELGETDADGEMLAL